MTTDEVWREVADDLTRFAGLLGEGASVADLKAAGYRIHGAKTVDCLCGVRCDHFWNYCPICGRFVHDDIRGALGGGDGPTHDPPGGRGVAGG